LLQGSGAVPEAMKPSSSGSRKARPIARRRRFRCYRCVRVRSRRR
jgi:hypothetical protein